MPRGRCHRHGAQGPCSCAMGNLYRFVEPVTLWMLFRRGSAHGYELGSELQEHALTDSLIDRSALYRVLQTLEANGHVTSTWDVSGGGPARHVYSLTPSGRQHLEEWVTVLEKLGASMQRFAAEARAALREAAVSSPR